MDRTAAIADIKRGLGFRQTQETTIIAKLQEAQRELEQGRTLPDFLIEYDSPITVTADDQNIVLPTGFIRFHDEYDMYYLNSASKKVFLPKRNFTEAYTAWIGTGTRDDSSVLPDTNDGYPQVVVQRGKTGALLLPTPTISFTAYLTYYKAAQVLDTNVENGWLLYAPDTIIGLAGMWCAALVRDKDAYNTFSQRFKGANAGMLADKIEDELSGRGLVMGRNN